MKYKTLLAATAALAVLIDAYGPAHAVAGIDLAATIVAPAQLAAGFDERIRLEIKNIGTVRSGNATADLNFSKHVQVLEVYSGSGSPCTILPNGSFQTIRCTYSGRNPGASFTPYVRVRAPSNIASTTFSYFVSTASDADSGNNFVSTPMSFTGIVPTVPQMPSDDVDVTLCAGSAYFDWSQCDTSSYVNYSMTLEYAGSQNGMVNTLVHLGTPVGTWSRPASNRLRLVYGNTTTTSAIFDLTAVSNRCYRGQAQYPNQTTPWFSQMRVCF